jgi:hypothetical protein
MAITPPKAMGDAASIEKASTDFIKWKIFMVSPDDRAASIIDSFHPFIPPNNRQDPIRWKEKQPLKSG